MRKYVTDKQKRKFILPHRRLQRKKNVLQPWTQVTKLRQNEETDQHQRDAKMLLRSGLEAGADDVNLTDLRQDEDAGIQEEKGKRKNPQVNLKK